MLAALAAKPLKYLFKLFDLDGDDPVTPENYEITETTTPAGVITPILSRRRFLAGFAATAAVGVIGPQNIIKAFSFPSASRLQRHPCTAAQILALQLEQVHPHLPMLYESDSSLYDLTAIPVVFTQPAHYTKLTARAVPV